MFIHVLFFWHCTYNGFVPLTDCLLIIRSAELENLLAVQLFFTLCTLSNVLLTVTLCSPQVYYAEKYGWFYCSYVK